jgi:hypothetical protein
MESTNLHNSSIIVDGGPPQLLSDYSTKVSSPHFDNVEVIFRNQENRLLDLIEIFENGAVFGCVAWLTGNERTF